MDALLVTDSMIWTAETEYALSVASAEASVGLSITVAAPSGSAIVSRAPECIHLMELPGVEPARSVADFTTCVRWLASLVRTERPRIVHSSRATAHLMAALACGKSVPIVHLRGGAAPPSRHVLNRYLYCSMTSAVIASSRRVEGWVVDGLGMDGSRVFRIYAPIDTERYAASAPDTELRKELGISPESRVVVNVARLAPVKGHDVLLDAMQTVLRRVPEAVLVLVGEPWRGQPEGLMRRAERLGIASSVYFAGRREDVPRFLAMADLCVSSSTASEENSRAVSEYMAAGRPVVGTGVGVIPELIVDGETGLIVGPGDEAELADCVVDLLTDAEHALRLGVAGRRRAEELVSRDAFSSSLARVLELAGIGAEHALGQGPGTGGDGPPDDGERPI